MVHIPLTIGTVYDGHAIVEIVDVDFTDDYQPFLYMLDDGTTVWIPHPDESEAP
jgi:hypothetical protein